MDVDSCTYNRWARWAGVSAPRRTRKHSSAGASKSTHSDIVANSPVSCDRTSSRPVLVFVLVSLQLYECNGTLYTAVSAIVTRTRSNTELNPITGSKCLSIHVNGNATSTKDGWEGQSRASLVKVLLEEIVRTRVRGKATNGPRGSGGQQDETTSVTGSRSRSRSKLYKVHSSPTSRHNYNCARAWQGPWS